MRRLILVAAAAATLLAASPVSPAGAGSPTPGSFTGSAFDTCTAPDNATMDAWLTTSPYLGVGVYIGGANRLCDDQPNLTADWVHRQSTRGWKVLPVWVGPQAACSGYATVIDDAPAQSYAAAAAQGRQQAGNAVAAAKELGIPAQSTLWFDLEDFDLQDSDDCRRSAWTFVSAWTRRLHALGYSSGLYGSAATVIHGLDYADSVSPSAYTEPDQIWYAWGNARADTAIKAPWVRSTSWTPHRRIHQYVLDVLETFGGQALTVDKNVMDVGQGSVAPKPSASCGVDIDFATYRTQALGDTGPQVKAAQCLLKQRGYYAGKVNGRFDLPTRRAVARFQNARHLTVTRTMSRSTWTALLSTGESPVVKRGSASNAVRRVQRALNAAGDPRLPVTGVFGATTTTAVRAYQSAVGLPATGVVASDTWTSLKSGRR